MSGSAQERQPGFRTPSHQSDFLGRPSIILELELTVGGGFFFSLRTMFWRNGFADGWSGGLLDRWSIGDPIIH
jgi:hypothetical protein